MRLDATPPEAQATAGDVLVAFPEHRILHARAAGREVAVSQAGQTTIYASEAALAAAFREHDPIARAESDRFANAIARAQALEAQAGRVLEEADARLTAACAAERRAETLLADARISVERRRRQAAQAGRLLLLASLAGLGAGVVAFCLPATAL